MNVSTAIYIDYDNLFRSINESYSQFQTYEVVNNIIGKMEQLKNKVHLVKAFCDFETASNEIHELQQSLVELRHVNSIGEGKSNASDIALAIDVVKSLYSNREFEHYVIVSSDSDMLPLVLELSYQGKKVTLVYLESKIKIPYTESLKNRISLLKIEDLLQVDTYQSLTLQQLNEQKEEVAKKYLNVINHEMNMLFVKYHSQPATVIYQKNILEALKNEETLKLQPSDATIVFEFLKNEKLLVALDVQVMMHGINEIRKAFFINENRLKELSIVLSEEILVRVEHANLIVSE
ncbi:MAG: NYN domain-containing protein [Kurthia sp.]|nr:NYN domain-containing protein [Candidatus Kurthia equi]